MERDWAADERLIASADNSQCDFEIVSEKAVVIAELALADRRRLAELLTWRPGPPTEPGLYLFDGPGIQPMSIMVLSDENFAAWRNYKYGSWLGPLPLSPRLEAAK